MSDLKFEGKYVISVRLKALTGLHIGGSTTGFEIGGVDNPVIRDPLTDEPYIPGSSLKGKLRHLTEWSLGLVAYSDKHKGYSAYECKELRDEKNKAKDHGRWEKAYLVGRLFGVASDDSDVRRTAGPTRLTVRDAFLSAETREALANVLGEKIFTEVKTENSIDRITSAANPRPLERVPKEAEFEVTMLLDRYNKDGPELMRQLFVAMRLLEDSTLGGSGSRGSGRVAFRQLRVSWRGLNYYLDGAEEKVVFDSEAEGAAEAPLEFLLRNGAFDRFFGGSEKGG